MLSLEHRNKDPPAAAEQWPQYVVASQNSVPPTLPMMAENTGEHPETTPCCSTPPLAKVTRAQRRVSSSSCFSSCALHPLLLSTSDCFLRQRATLLCPPLSRSICIVGLFGLCVCIYIYILVFLLHHFISWDSIQHRLASFPLCSLCPELLGLSQNIILSLFTIPVYCCRCFRLWLSLNKQMDKLPRGLPLCLPRSTGCAASHVFPGHETIFSHYGPWDNKEGACDRMGLR